MKVTDNPMLRAIKKVAPALMDALVASGVRDFATLSVEGGTSINWFGVLRTQKTLWTDATYASALAAGKAGYSNALLDTASLAISNGGAGPVLSNCDAYGVAGNPYAAKLRGSERELGLTTTVPKQLVINAFSGCTMIKAPSVSSSEPTALCTLTSEGHTFMASICSMFGLEYLRSVPSVLGLVRGNTAGTSANAVIADSKRWPSWLGAAPPGVQFLHVSLPASKTSDYFLGDGSIKDANDEAA